ncbi:MAG TPA: ADOP family duplicated permease [Thermoanaerobaculia bacterium]|nr:ADOP family duplicated permease [Thermoanaerobaculia bacterium]
MTRARLLAVSERLFRLLLRSYPADFRDEMGEALVETCVDRARAALQRRGTIGLALVCLRALLDFPRNGLAERLRPAIAWRRSGNWGRETELALRRLRRAPAFALSVIATLTVGLGAFTVVAAVVDNVLVAPLPYENSDDLYFVWRDYTWFDLDRGWLGGTDVAELRKAGGVIEDAVAIGGESFTLSQKGGGVPEQIDVMISSAGLFELLGVPPALGRGFAAGEDHPGRPAVVVLGHDLWNRRFAADSAILGSDIILDGAPYTVIGVMPREFRFVRNASLGPPAGADAYITLDEDLAATNPTAGSYAGLVRARRGSSPEQVEAAVAAVGRIVDERDMQGRGLRLYPVGAKEDLVAPIRPALVLLGWAGVVLVVILMVNLGTLLLVRAAQREREFTISRALGANASAVARAIVLEGAVLGLAGGALGALAGRWGTELLVALAPADLPRRDAIAADWRVTCLAIAAGALIGILAGAVPGIWSARSRLATLLGAAAVRGGGRGHGRLWRAMIVVQVALSLVLLSSGALLVRSFEGLLRSDPGFDASGLLTLRVPIYEERVPDDAIVPLHERLRSELEAIPGVNAVGATTSLPLTADTNQTTFEFPGAPGNTGVEEADQPLIDLVRAREGTLEALGIAILEGREMRATGAEGSGEMMIDRILASRFYPNGTALGATIPAGDTTLTIVGVVEHARMYDLHEDGRGQVYLPNDDFMRRNLYWVLRSDRDQADLVAETRAAVRRVDPELAIADVRPMEGIVEGSIREHRLTAVLISGFSAGALLLASMGLFGIVASTVTRRRHELAIRLALGADHGRLWRMVLGEGASLVAIGLLIGVPGILLAGGTLRNVLIGVSPFDASTLLAVAAALAVVSLAACWIPAQRVTRIHPAVALRDE